MNDFNTTPFASVSHFTVAEYASTTEVPSFHELVTEANMPGKPDAAAAYVMHRLQLNELQRQVLWSIIVGECRNIDRNRVRSIERDADDKPNQRRIGTPVNPTARRSQFLQSTFALPDGRRVTWGEATIQDHEARIAYLSKQQKGIGETIGLHRSVINEIKTAAVTCLNEARSVA